MDDNCQFWLSDYGPEVLRDPFNPGSNSSPLDERVLEHPSGKLFEIKREKSGSTI